MMCATVAAMGVLLVATVGSAEAATGQIGRPTATGTLRIHGTLRDGAVVTAQGLTWHHAALPPGDRLLSFEVGYSWRACTTATGTCVPAADSTATPYAAARYIVGHADTGRHLRLTVTAREVIETDPATFTFKIVHAIGDHHHLRQGGAVCRRAGAHQRIHQRHARAPHRVKPGTVSGLPGALRQGRRRPHRHLPGRLGSVEAAARRPRVRHRDARTRQPPGAGAHRKPCRHHHQVVRLAGGGAAQSPGVRAQRQLLVSPAPRQHRSSDAVGLADRTGDTTPAHRRARRRYL